MNYSGIYLLYLVVLFSCARNADNRQSKTILSIPTTASEDSILLKYTIKDTISTLTISSQECTECLDAWIDSGIAYIPPYVATEIILRSREIKTFKQRRYVSIPSNRDLYLTGYKNIASKLFGNCSNYGDYWHNKYKITGKVIGVSGIGLIFRIDHYKKIN